MFQTVVAAVACIVKDVFSVHLDVRTVVHNVFRFCFGAKHEGGVVGLFVDEVHRVETSLREVKAGKKLRKKNCDYIVGKPDFQPSFSNSDIISVKVQKLV